MHDGFASHPLGDFFALWPPLSLPPDRYNTDRAQVIQSELALCFGLLRWFGS
jgi:hypothetical protein